MEALLLPLALMARDNYSGQNESETMELRKVVVRPRICHRRRADRLSAAIKTDCEEGEEEQDNRFMTRRGNQSFRRTSQASVPSLISRPG